MKVTMPFGVKAVSCTPCDNETCPECGKLLPPRQRAWQVYCSKYCRMKAFRANKRRKLRTNSGNDFMFPPVMREALEARRRGELITRPKLCGNPKVDMEFLTAWSLAEEYAASLPAHRGGRPKPLPVTDADARAANIDDD